MSWETDEDLKMSTHHVSLSVFFLFIFFKKKKEKPKSLLLVFQEAGKQGKGYGHFSSSGVVPVYTIVHLEVLLAEACLRPYLFAAVSSLGRHNFCVI
jgi:hypothetical protein